MPRAVRTRDPTGDPRVFLALADPTRRRILQLLGAGEQRAGAIAQAFPISRPAVSKHLRVLLEAGLVSVRKTGRERWYAVVPGPLRDAAALVQEIDGFWRDGLHRLGDHLAEGHGGSRRGA
ncbi:MAG TPA: metalloregulator ArsR/SmtB family transcription factor [Candidatus Thermoplasmatota archaeon]|nr:metalloregulator ArsR/SmtB family transcription factor [Candidatus Thermoplasmatota archaeon]